MKILRSVLAVILVSVLSGCATSYSNRDLIDVFSAQGLRTEETERGVVVFLPEVFFEFAKFDLTPAAQEKIPRIATVINDRRASDRHIAVEGHTDSVGNDAYNLNLSTQRANTVEQELIASEVAAERITSSGYGEKYPVAPNSNPDGSDNPEGRAKNRRVEIVVENPSSKPK